MSTEPSQKSSIDNLFELLSSKNLLRKEKISIPHIEKLSRRSILDLSEKILESTEDSNIRSETSKFSHSSSLGLGGGRAEGCTALECRLERIDDLARFALMYSDSVYINNYFCDYQHHADIELFDLRQMLFEDLFILQRLKPLIDKGFISILTPKNICSYCFSLKDFDKNIEKRIESERKNISKQILDVCSVSLRNSEGNYTLHITGPEKFIEHGSLYEECDLTAADVSSKNIANGEEYPLRKYQIKNLHIPEEIAQSLIKNVSYEIASNQVLGTSFLTDRELHISMLMNITEDYEMKQKNILASKHLTSILPFFDELDIKRLMKLRDRETESFIKYRSALNCAISEFKNSRGTFTEADAKNMYNDIIRPEIASLDQKVKLSKSDLMDSARRTTVSTVGALSFGVYMGMEQTAIISMAGVMGFAQILKELMAVGDKEKKVRDHDLYFLWKAKELTKKR